MALRAKPVLTVLFLILLVIGGALYYLLSNLNSIVAGVIEEQGSAVTQTPVSVSGVDIRLREASAAISGLSVANPAGFEGNAIELGGFSIALNAASLRSDTVIVREITVDSASIRILQDGASNNLKALLDNLPQGPSEEGTVEPEEGSTKKLIIERFALLGANASLSAPDLDTERAFTLPDIVVTDIGKKTNGATASEVARQVLEPVLDAAIKSAAAEELKARAGEKVDEAIGGVLKKLGGGKK